MRLTGPVTVYNRYYDAVDGVNTYHRTMIPNAWWYATVQTSVGDGGLNRADVYSVKIPTDHGADKQYIDAIEYQKLAVDQLDKYFTFAPEDKIVNGDIPFIWQAGVKGYTISDLEKKYSDVMTVLSHNIRDMIDDPFHSLKGA